MSRPGLFCPIRLNNEPTHLLLPLSPPGVKSEERKQRIVRNEAVLDSHCLCWPSGDGPVRFSLRVDSLDLKEEEMMIL